MKWLKIIEFIRANYWLLLGGVALLLALSESAVWYYGKTRELSILRWVGTALELVSFILIGFEFVKLGVGLFFVGYLVKSIPYFKEGRIFGGLVHFLLFFGKKELVDQEEVVNIF